MTKQIGSSASEVLHENGEAAETDRLIPTEEATSSERCRLRNETLCAAKINHLLSIRSPEESAVTTDPAPLSNRRTEAPAAPPERWTVRRVLDWTTGYLQQHGSESPRLEAEILLAHARRCPRVQLYTRIDEELTPRQRETMRTLVQRRAKHEPVAYLVGFREFYSLDFQVQPGVLIPRPDTETLVLELIESARQQPAPRILDVGTGSGCIAVTAAVHLPAARITAVDLSAEALQTARHNAARHGVEERIRFLQGDLFEPLKSGTAPEQGEPFDFIVSNPPYVAEEEWKQLPEDIRRYEPALALRGGKDGLDIIRRLIAEAPQFLAPQGRLLFELSPEQDSDILALLNEAGCYTDARLICDLSNSSRVAVAVKE